MRHCHILHYRREVGLQRVCTKLYIPASCLLPLPLASSASCLLPPVSYLVPLPPASCLLFPASCFLPPVSCLLFPASCLFLLSPASCLPSLRTVLPLSSLLCLSRDTQKGSPATLTSQSHTEQLSVWLASLFRQRSPEQCAAYLFLSCL